MVPGYGRSTLADLLPSLAAHLGVPGAQDVLGLPDAERYLVVLVDGLGAAQLAAYAPGFDWTAFFAGIGIPAGKKSLAFSFSLRAEDHTQTDEEIKRGMDAIIDALKASGAPLRA